MVIIGGCLANERTNERSEGLPPANGAFGGDDKLKGER